MGFQWIKLKPHPRKDLAVALKESEKAFLQRMGDENYVVSFDERGPSLSSEAFAKKVETAMASGQKKSPSGSSAAPMVWGQTYARGPKRSFLYRRW